MSGDAAHDQDRATVRVPAEESALRPTQNFNTLELAWRFSTNNLGPRPEFVLQGTPLMIGGTLYATGGGGNRRRIAARRLGDRGVDLGCDRRTRCEAVERRAPENLDQPGGGSCAGGWSGPTFSGASAAPVANMSVRSMPMPNAKPV